MYYYSTWDGPRLQRTPTKLLTTYGGAIVRPCSRTMEECSFATVLAAILPSLKPQF